MKNTLQDLPKNLKERLRRWNKVKTMIEAFFYGIIEKKELERRLNELIESEKSDGFVYVLKSKKLSVMTNGLSFEQALSRMPENRGTDFELLIYKCKFGEVQQTGRTSVKAPVGSLMSTIDIKLKTTRI